MITLDPNSPFNGMHETCGGLWIIAADGKSGTGKGSCGYADQQGNAYWIEYDGEFAGGTYTYKGGTGKLKGLSGGGTWKGTQGRYGSGLGVRTFAGTYQLPN